MKNLILLFLLIPFSLSAQIKTDKYYHAGAGIIISASTYSVGQFSNREMNPIAPSLLALTGGCAKEFYDVMNGGRFNGKDFAFTALSGIVTNVILRAVWRPKKRYIKFDNIDFNPPLVKK